MFHASEEAAGMLQKALSRPIVLQGDPPRTIDTVVAAIEFLASSAEKGAPEIEATIDQLISASQSEDPVALSDVTERLVRLLHQRGQV